MKDSLINEKDARKCNIQAAVPVDVLANIDTATVEAIPVGSARTGGMSVPTGQTYITLTFYVSHSGVNGTYQQLFDASNVAISKTVAAGRAYPLPPEVFNFNFLKIVVAANPGNISISLKT